MNKQIMGILGTLLMIGTVLAPINSGAEIPFEITIDKDASISISNLRTNDSTSSLKFELGITGKWVEDGCGEVGNETDCYINNVNASDFGVLPYNVDLISENASLESGQWNITNIGNYNMQLRVKLSEKPTGIYSEVGETEGYSVDYKELDTDEIQYVSDLAKDANIKFWQRVASTSDAVPGPQGLEALKVIITSIPI
ncbi:MAG: hypothetical protein WC376_00950 [Candidatus Nanoarchaeia archaeon]|jgi:hypothetical protein